MRELLFTILELEKWHSSNSTCVFCSGLKKAVCQIRTRSKATGELIGSDKTCESCKEKFENDELPKCSCGRLKTRYTCDCKEERNEKELPSVPYESQTVFYERQINKLREEKTTAEITIEEEREAHEDFMRVSEEWSKRQKQELLDRIKVLEAEVEKLKKQTPQTLVDEVENYKKEIEGLKSQLEQFQQTAQIETPPKDKGIKGFFKFGGKK